MNTKARQPPATTALFGAEHSVRSSCSQPTASNAHRLGSQLQHHTCLTCPLHGNQPDHHLRELTRLHRQVQRCRKRLKTLRSFLLTSVLVLPRAFWKMSLLMGMSHKRN